jgi:hypothetical protein
MAPLVHELVQQISAHVFGVKQNVHVLVVVHGVGSAGALPALGSVCVAACAWRLRRGDRCRLDMLAKGPWSARVPCSCSSAVSRVSILCGFVFTPAIDRGARARVVSVEAARLGSGGVDPTP